jgi:hypothetical protein
MKRILKSALGLAAIGALARVAPADTCHWYM